MKRNGHLKADTLWSSLQLRAISWLFGLVSVLLTTEGKKGRENCACGCCCPQLWFSSPGSHYRVSDCTQTTTLSGYLLLVFPPPLALLKRKILLLIYKEENCLHFLASFWCWFFISLSHTTLQCLPKWLKSVCQHKPCERREVKLEQKQDAADAGSQLIVHLSPSKMTKAAQKASSQQIWWFGEATPSAPLFFLRQRGWERKKDPKRVMLVQQQRN